MNQFLDFFSIDVWTIVFSLGNLLILFLLMKKFLFKPIRNILEERERMIQNDLDGAKNARQEAEEKNAAYTALLENAKSESENIIKSANRRATLDGEKILQTAREQAAGIVRNGEKQIEMEKQQAYLDIKDEISGMAITIAATVVGREVDAAEHSELIDRAIEELRDHA